jgi:hypothetical protein
MKKIIISGIFVNALALVAFNFYNNSSKAQVSNLTLENIEALAGGDDPIYGGELPGATITCGRYEGQCWYPDNTYPAPAWEPFRTCCTFTGNPSHGCVFIGCD